MEIRRLRPDDVGAVAVMVEQLGYSATAAEVARRIAVVADDPSSEVLVAVLDAQVVGWVHVNEVTMLQVGTFAGIPGLVVADGHRGTGIGGALLEAAEAWGRERGHTLMRIRSNVIREAAHGFYRRRGYETEKQSFSFTKSL